LELSLIDVQSCHVASHVTWTNELTAAGSLRASVAELFAVVPHEKAHSHRAGYLMFGSGALALAGAGTFALLAHSARNELAQSCIDTGDNRICSDQARGSLAADRRWSILADASLGTGVVLAGIGAYLLWRNHGTRRSEREHVMIAPTADGWSV